MWLGKQFRGFSTALMKGRRLTRILGFLAFAMLAASPVEARDSDDVVEGAVGPHGERLRYDEKGLTLTFPEPEVKLQIGGRLHIDAGAVGLSRPDLPGAFPDNVAVRRVCRAVTKPSTGASASC